MRTTVPFLLVLCVAPAAQAEITGTKTQVTFSAGDQFDPAIDGSIIVYTDHTGAAMGDDVRYVDLTGDVTNPANHVFVVSAPGDQRLHDVSGDTVVYTDYSDGSQRVFEYDIVAGVATELATTAGNPTIDGNQVVFESLDGVGGASEVGLADLTLGTVTTLTATSDWERNPSIGGDYVAFERSTTSSSPTSVVVRHVYTGEEWPLDFGIEPHTDGKVVVYAATSVTGDLDVFVYDIGSGTTQQIVRAGDQRRPHVDGGFIAFDEAVGFEEDVIVMHLATQDFVEVGNGTVEVLNDLDGNRVAFTSYDSGRDIFVFEFSHDGPTDPPPPGPTTDDPCSDLTGLTLEGAWEFQRERGAPTQYNETFDADLDQAVVVVRNDGCASGVVEFNGEEVVSPNDLNANATCGSGIVSLAGTNTLDVEVRSRPGCVLTVEVYSVDDPAATAPGCSQQSASGMMPFAWFGLLLLVPRRRRR